MNSKIIPLIVALVIVAVFLFIKISNTSNLTVPSSNPSVTPSGSAVTTTDTAVEASMLINSEYSSLIQEELDKLSVEQTDFNIQTQESIANDLSQFYYT